MQWIQLVSCQSPGTLAFTFTNCNSDISFSLKNIYYTFGNKLVYHVWSCCLVSVSTRFCSLWPKKIFGEQKVEEGKWHCRLFQIIWKDDINCEKCTHENNCCLVSSYNHQTPNSNNLDMTFQKRAYLRVFLGCFKCI